MPEFKIVINDVKQGKSYQSVLDNDNFIGKKIGEKVEGNVVGLQGYELEITGGSDTAGFPIRRDVDGSGRKKILIGKGVGLKKVAKDVRKKKSVRGNIISDQIKQINLKIIKYGSKDVKELLEIKEDVKEEKKEEKHKEEKKHEVKEHKKEVTKEEVKE